MRGWAWLLWLALVASVAAMGCSKSKNTTATVTVSVIPSSATVLLNTSAQFIASVSGSNNAVSWDVNGTAGGNATIGTVDATGVYTAPAVLPGTNSVTINAAVQGTSATAAATVTLDSGVRVSVVPSGVTVGTGETYKFTATVSGTSTTDVTWSVSGAGGSISSTGPTTAVYTAPGTTGTDTVKATSVADTGRTATATVTVVTAQDPALTSISPTIGARGALFQDIYLTGANFISTTIVSVNGTSINDPSAIFAPSSTTLRVRLFDTFLDAVLAKTPTSAGSPLKLTFTAAAQNGLPKGCSPDCRLVLSPVRPAIVGASPDSIPLPSGASPPHFNVNGGYFGTSSNPVVNTFFGGKLITPSNSDRQLSVTVDATAASKPGLYPLAVVSAGSSGEAVANLAVQPAYSSAPAATASLPVGAQPVSVAINTATGMAVVANQASNDVTLINLATQAVVAASIPVGTAPTGVAVDNLRNIALVANSGSANVAVVDVNPLSATFKSVLFIITPNVSGTPAAVGINPVTGRAILAYQNAGFALIVDLTPLDLTPRQKPIVTRSVSISTGANTRVAVSPKLNWALVTPGGSGSLSVVDLNRQTVNGIASAVRSSGGIVTITTTATHALRVGEAVLIQDVADASFNGVFSVTPVTNTTFTYSQSGSSASSGGGTASYALPVVTLATTLGSGIAINDETQKAVFAYPGGASIFNVLDQSSTAVTGLPPAGNVGAAFNPLANIAVIVNSQNNNAVIDPVTGSALTTFSVGSTPVDVAIDPGTNTAVIVNQGDNTASIVPLGALRAAPHVLQASLPTIAQSGTFLSGPTVVVGSTLASGVGQPGSPPVNAQTLTIIGSGFTANSAARLDGTNLATSFVSDRKLTATVPANMQIGPRQYALDVCTNSPCTSKDVVSNASSFTVIQSVNIAGSGCTSVPQGVAIDATNNLAVITDPGCSDVALLNLATGTGTPVLVGTNPQGVAVLPQAGLAVVANHDSNTASIVDEINQTVTATVNTDVGPTGVAIDLGTGNAVVAATGANVVDVFPVSSSPGTPKTVAVQQGPAAVSIDPTRHLAAVANVTSNNMSLVDLTQNSATTITGNVPCFSPTGIAFDPVSADFLVTCSVRNEIRVLDPGTQFFNSSIRVGINPTSIAYNFASSTLVTSNSLSQTMTVIDFLDSRVRAVFSLTPSGQFAVDIHPLLNLAVVADPVNHRVLLLPLPR